jgi:hypothetical protein
MTDPRCGIANPGPLLLYPPFGFHTASPSLYPAFRQVYAPEV